MPTETSFKHLWPTIIFPLQLHSAAAAAAEVETGHCMTTGVVIEGREE